MSPRHTPPAGVYPRVCGGTVTPSKFRRMWIGLSPRVRGNLFPCRRAQPLDGSIPACAGEPSPDPVPFNLILVYPRVCGGTFAARLT